MRHRSIGIPVMITLVFMVVSCASSAAKRSSMMSTNKEECGCGISGKKMIMTIKWHRLLSKGGTCPRCGATEHELNIAVDILGKSLTELGIKIVLEKDSLSVAEFEKDPLRSNQIWINNRPIEDYVAGKSGQSPCCDVCGPVECRTLEMDGQAYEVIPSEIIVKAGLVAASQMIMPDKKEPCCRDEY